MTTDRTGAPTTVTQRGTEFTITVDGRTVGAAVFEDHGDRRVFVHTEVDDAFQGRGLAPSLIGVGQRTACWNQLTRVDGTWRVDGYGLKPYEPRPVPVSQAHPNGCGGRSRAADRLRPDGRASACHLFR